MPAANRPFDHCGARAAGAAEQTRQFQHRRDAASQIAMFSTGPFPPDRSGQRDQPQRRNQRNDHAANTFNHDHSDSGDQQPDSRPHAETKRVVGPESEQRETRRIRQHDRQSLDQQPRPHASANMRQPRDELPLQQREIGEGEVLGWWTWGGSFLVRRRLELIPFRHRRPR